MSSSSLLESYVKDARVWFPDKEKGWLSGHVSTRAIEGDQVKFGFIDDNGKASPLFRCSKGVGGVSGERAVARKGSDRQLYCV